MKKLVSKLLLPILLLLLFFGYTNIVYAEIVTINIAAEVSYIDDIGGLLEGSINVGDTLVGHYTYETTTPDSNTWESVGDYRHNSVPYGITVSGGELLFKTDPLNTDFLVEIVNDHYSGRDNYLLRSYNNLPLSNGTFVEHISWQLDDDTQTALTSAELTALPPNLPDWQSIFGLTITGNDYEDPYYYPYENEFFIRAHVTSAEVAAVPIPASIYLLGSAIVSFAGLRFNKNKSN